MKDISAWSTSWQWQMVWVQLQLFDATAKSYAFRQPFIWGCIISRKLYKLKEKIQYTHKCMCIYIYITLQVRCILQHFEPLRLKDIFRCGEWAMPSLASVANQISGCPKLLWSVGDIHAVKPCRIYTSPEAKMSVLSCPIHIVRISMYMCINVCVIHLQVRMVNLMIQTNQMYPSPHWWWPGISWKTPTEPWMFRNA